MVETSLKKILEADWEFLVSRPYTILGTSLYQAWFDGPKIFEVFGDSIADDIYIEEHKNIVRRYVTKSQNDHFKNTISDLIKDRPNYYKTLIDKAFLLNDEAVFHLSKPHSLNWDQAVNFLIELALHSTILPYFSYPIVQEMGDKDILEKVEKLRAISHYSDIIEMIIKPQALKVAGNNFEMLTLSEIGVGDFSSAARRRDLHNHQGFIFTKYNGQESIFWTDNSRQIISELEHFNIEQNIKGRVAFPGKIIGKVKLILSNDPGQDFKEGSILVTVTTNPRLLPLVKKAGAIVTDEGGIMCHAAIISRELKTPCIIGARNATHILKDGDIVEVDADKGIVKILERAK